MPSSLPHALARDLAILIVEDERPARSELKRMLLSLGMTGPVQEASSVVDALHSVNSARPDIILLDVQMPGGSGFDLLRQLGQNRPPVIFTTAYDQFAARAFEEEAVDYLLKPFSKQRLARALSKLISDKNHGPCLSIGDHVLLKLDGECMLIAVENIESIKKTDDGTIVYYRGNSGLINRSIASLEDQLDPKIFFRASRDSLIKISWIHSLSIRDSGDLIAHLPGYRTVVFSRRQRSLFHKMHGA